ncbi:hypothetical protein KM043_011421 [Ampulex compressa]|nr:hypothetical protein KM043_011421 [Ampulex compressa]
MPRLGTARTGQTVIGARGDFYQRHLGAGGKTIPALVGIKNSIRKSATADFRFKGQGLEGRTGEERFVIKRKTGYECYGVSVGVKVLAAGDDDDDDEDDDGDVYTCI